MYGPNITIFEFEMRESTVAETFGLKPKLNRWGMTNAFLVQIGDFDHQVPDTILSEATFRLVKFTYSI